jgi:hypothetical protein
MVQTSSHRVIHRRSLSFSRPCSFGVLTVFPGLAHQVWQHFWQQSRRLSAGCEHRARVSARPDYPPRPAQRKRRNAGPRGGPSAGTGLTRGFARGDRSRTSEARVARAGGGGRGLAPYARLPPPPLWVLPMGWPGRWGPRHIGRSFHTSRFFRAAPPHPALGSFCCGRYVL